MSKNIIILLILYPQHGIAYKIQGQELIEEYQKGFHKSCHDSNVCLR